MAIEAIDALDTRAQEPARKFYRVKEASAVLGIPIRTLYHLAETEQIPCRRLGNVILLPVAWVESDTQSVRRR